MHELIWPLIIFLAAQTIAAIWWAASLTVTVKGIQSDVSEIKTDFDGVFPLRDGNRLERRIDIIEKKVWHGHA